MMDRCPICRGRVSEEALCKRCGANLALVAQTRDEAKTLTQQAVEKMVSGEFVQSKYLLKQALLLEHSLIRLQLLKFVRLNIADGSMAYPPKVARLNSVADRNSSSPFFKRVGEIFKTGKVPD